jgi:hypothetical protein
MSEQKKQPKAALTAGLVLAWLLSAFTLLVGSPAVADRGPIQPLEQTERPLSMQQQQAQRPALASAPVQRYVEGERAEVFAILPFRDPFVPTYDACHDGSCYQVDAFDFDQAATASATTARHPLTRRYSRSPLTLLVARSTPPTPSSFIVPRSSFIVLPHAPACASRA